jgi:hypothetical protein
MCLEGPHQSDPRKTLVADAVEVNRLILRLPPRGAYYELTHWGGDSFSPYFASESTGLGPLRRKVLPKNIRP